MPGVLITGAANAEAYRVGALLDNPETFFADYQELPKFSKKFVSIPKGDSPSFAHKLLTICLDLGIIKIFPLYKDEIIALAEASILFEEYGISIMIPSVDLIETYLNKQLKSKVNTLIILEKGNIIGGNLSETMPVDNLTGVFNWSFENNSYELTLFTIENANIH